MIMITVMMMMMVKIIVIITIILYRHTRRLQATRRCMDRHQL